MNASHFKASKTDRFINHIIDYIIVTIISGTLNVLLILISPDLAEETNEKKYTILSYGISLTIFFLYFFIFESNANGKTIGKYVTKTSVVTPKGNQPTTSQIAKRTLCRFIPFDAFSFLFSDSGWHDSIPDLYVVSDAKLKEYKNNDIENIGTE